jgi:hypothetical protein
MPYVHVKKSTVIKESTVIKKSIVILSDRSEAKGVEGPAVPFSGLAQSRVPHPRDVFVFVARVG